MKKDYIAPDADCIIIRLPNDVLADSRIQNTDAPLVPDPTNEDPFDF